ncbi:type IV pilus twitching motility protein PilT [Oceanobacillus piezotolerans]|uniref:Type IV pilus twitching motility protein PilT n=1 Tax=Oceanobacillus piezotolerans TaxID=2448030 RepID=A0A498D982_9BACI|nr:type IV pilus twitching motility protein PilT [Oceanobacillus piezotolerans]RLL47863.1 type IV pilus twitching motility protein PilT [Oceanobacillus piezotolerans]
MPYDIDQLLRKAYTMGASDLHLTVNSPPILRINGRLIHEGKEALTKIDTERMAEHIISKGDWDRFMEVGEHDFSYYLEKTSRFRVNAYHQKQQIGIVARVIPKEIPTIEQLRMPTILENLAEKPQGLILVTGPTGSGKSTTLAAMIHYINQHEAKHIITLEDPIEYVHQHRKSIVNQREVGIDTQSFSNGLRAALRQDPDIILVGEMRDHETISTAITAAETGHLVLATLHTNSAAQTINRIIDVFPPHQQAQIRIQLASVLEGIISQRLIPTADRTGRVAATEILINLPSVANLIRNEKVDQINNILQTSRASGMHTLEMSVRELLTRGVLDGEAASHFLSSAGDY